MCGPATNAVSLLAVVMASSGVGERGVMMGTLKTVTAASGTVRSRAAEMG